MSADQRESDPVSRVWRCLKCQMRFISRRTDPKCHCGGQTKEIQP